MYERPLLVMAAIVVFLSLANLGVVHAAIGNATVPFPVARQCGG